MSDTGTRNNTISLIIDTNFLIEFKNIDQCPWHEIGDYTEIFIILTEPVQTEVDELKKANKPRTRRRAIKWSKLIRNAMHDEKSEIVFIDSGPRVSVVLDFSLPMEEHKSFLDYRVTDDLIVGIATTLASRDKGSNYVVFSDDSRPIRKSKLAHVTSLSIPDE